MTSQECIHEGELRDISFSNEDNANIDEKVKRIFVISPFGYPYDDISPIPERFLPNAHF